jgi:hypothetical protein
MLVPHFGVGLAAKRVAPKTSAGILMLVSLLPDFLAWIFLLAGSTRPCLPCRFHGDAYHSGSGNLSR